MTKDWTHLAEFSGKWVALADDETTILAVADTAEVARAAALAQSKTPILFRVPDASESNPGHDRRA